MVEVLAILFGAAVFGGLGVLASWAAVLMMQEAANDEAGSLRADGVVVEFRTSRDSGLVDGNPKSPVVRFSTASGEEVEFQSSVGSDPSKYSVGQRVPVAYRANDPARADIVQAHVFFCILLLLFGVTFLGIGILVLGVAGLRVWRAIC